MFLPYDVKTKGVLHKSDATADECDYYDEYRNGK